MRTRPVRTATLLAGLAAAALPLTACSSGTTPAPGAAAAPSSAAPATASAPASVSAAPSTGGGTTAPAPSGSLQAQAQAAGQDQAQARSAAGGGHPAPCRSGQLTVAQSSPDVGAGQYYARLTFTNVSGTSCTLTGYPGVSYVAGGGVQSGNAAGRSAGKVVTVTLRPHGTAAAVLHDSNGMGGYTPAQCDLSAAQGLRVYPPDQRAALFLPWRTRHCAGASVHSLTIGPVQG